MPWWQGTHLTRQESVVARKITDFEIFMNLHIWSPLEYEKCCFWYTTRLCVRMHAWISA
jgi:hypothetical protein